MTFTWDEEKNIFNIKKNKQSFQTTIKVFFDPNRVVIYDEEHSALSEDRYITIGFINTIPIFLVYPMIADEMIGIISASKATTYVEKLYHNQ